MSRSDRKCQWGPIGHNLRYNFSIFDQIWENPQYGINARFAQCAFLVPQVKICENPVFVMVMC